MFVIQHKSGLYTNMTFQGLDALNLGINPKVYKDEDSAKKDLESLEKALAHNRQVIYNGRQSLEYKVKTLKPNNKKIQWYKDKLEELDKREQRENGYVLEDFMVIAL